MLVKILKLTELYYTKESRTLKWDKLRLSQRLKHLISMHRWGLLPPEKSWKRNKSTRLKEMCPSSLRRSSNCPVSQNSGPIGEYKVINFVFPQSWSTWRDLWWITRAYTLDWRENELWMTKSWERGGERKKNPVHLQYNLDHSLDYLCVDPYQGMVRQRNFPKDTEKDKKDQRSNLSIQ